MFGNINFWRFDKNTKDVPNYRYDRESPARDYEGNPQIISMEAPGFNMHISVMNYMAEAVMLNANVRSTPTRITSLVKDGSRTRNDQRNYVLVKIHHSENPSLPNPKSKTIVSKTEIRIPGHMLNQGSVFIEELDCYLTTESNLEATRELIARDLADRHGETTINLPSSLIVQDPVTIYHEYKTLVDFCIRRQDYISIRTGFDARHNLAPDTVRNMRVAILDHYFVPFAYDKLVFDPTLKPDEFIIENLHLAAKGEFRFTFSELSTLGAVALDGAEQQTMFGKFYGMALFASEAHYADYVYKRKAKERFHDEQTFLAEKSGDPMLKEEIVTLQRNLSLTQATLHEREQEVTGLRSDKTRLMATVSERDKTIKAIAERHDAKMSADVVLRTMDNDANKVENETFKLENDRLEQVQRTETVKLTQRANVLKYIADIMKSGWGITSGIVGGILTIFALLKKYNVKVTMG